MGRCIHWIAISVIALPTLATAAPPKVDYLFPAGGQRGTTVEVAATGTFERWPVQAWVDGKGVAVKPGKSSGKLTITIAKDAEPGVCWIRLFDAQGASIARPFIVGVLPEVREKEPNDDPKKPQAVDAPAVINGQLQKSGDVDTYAVKAMKGQTLVASLEAHQTLRSPMDGVLQVLSGDGFVLERNDDYHGLDPQIAFTVPRDGTYLVRVFAFPSVPDSSIKFAGKETFVYRLTLTTGPFVEYAYPLAIARQAPASVELVGWNLPADLRKFTVTPRDGPDVMTLFDPRIAQPFRVRLEPNPAVANTKSPLTVVPPITISGRLDKDGAVDVYRFDATKGQKLAIRIEAASLGFPLDPVLRLTGADGKTIQQTQAKKLRSDPSLDFTVPADGTYGVEVSDLYAHGGLRHVYRLRIGAPTPDFELKVAAESFTLMAGKPLEIPVTVTRSSGHKLDIAFSVAGLPNEISMTASAKSITLRADKFAFSGPIRIAGTAKDGVVREARAAVAELGRTTENLWLTAAAK